MNKFNNLKMHIKTSFFQNDAVELISNHQLSIINWYLAFALCLMPFAVYQGISQTDEYRKVEKFNRIFLTALKNHVDEPNSDELIEAAIEGMMEKLDPHSVYFNPEKMQKIRDELDGSFSGIGISYTKIRDTIHVISIITESPADLAGILKEDKIIAIDDSSAIGLDDKAIENKLRGSLGTTVKLSIIHRNEQSPINLELIRDKIVINSVGAAFIISGTDIGFLWLNRFRENTYEEALDSLRSLKRQGMKKLILDLRGNPGGYFKYAPKLVDEFVPEGKKIVYTKGRRQEFNEIHYSSSAGDYENIPLIVLIDAATASSSEIVAGAIQDLDRGLLIGETTYGKGLVQRQYSLDDGSAYRITTAKYYTPSGRCIQRPYNDVVQYKNLQGRFEIKVGESLEDALYRIRQEKGEDSLPTLYKTAKGRYVVGNGGITPDYAVKYDTITSLTKTIKSKNLFFSYILNNSKKFEDDISFRYNSKFNQYLKKFNTSEKMLDEFKSLCVSQKIEWDETQYMTDINYIKLSLKAVLARYIWGTNEYMTIMLPNSSHIRKAIELFPEAEDLAGLH